MSHFVIACGGTGGHLAPGISLARQLTESGHSCRLIISRKQVDQRLTQGYPDLAFESIPGQAPSLRPHLFWGFLTAFVGHFIASRSILKRDKPEGVIAFGGFLSLGLVLMAKLSDLPVFLHEANRKPGRAVRLLARFATRLYLPDGVYMPMISREFVRHYGYPVRQEFRYQPKEAARKALGLEITTGRLLVVVGGSQGAKPLNDWVKKECAKLAESGVNIYCVTGLQGGAKSELQWKQENGKVVKTWFVPFTDQMATVLSSADIVVSRAGAGTLAEVARCRVPSLLVPFPQSADDHQAENAKYYEQRGAAVIVTQDRLEELRKEVLELIFNDWLITQMRRNLERLDLGNDQKSMVRDIESVLRKKGGFKNQPQPSPS